MGVLGLGKFPQQHRDHKRACIAAKQVPRTLSQHDDQGERVGERLVPCVARAKQRSREQGPELHTNALVERGIFFEPLRTRASVGMGLTELEAQNVRRAPIFRLVGSVRHDLDRRCRVMQ